MANVPGSVLIALDKKLNKMNALIARAGKTSGGGREGGSSRGGVDSRGWEGRPHCSSTRWPAQLAPSALALALAKALGKYL